MPDDVVAPGSPAPSPAPAQPAPAAPATPVAAPVAAPASPAAAPAAPTPADYTPLLSKLGYQTEDDLARDLAFTRQFRAEAERVRQERERSDPGRQQAAQRGEAFRQLVAEGYSAEHADALHQLPEISQFLNQQRAESATRDLTDALGDAGLTFDGTPEQKEIFSIIEDSIADRLNADPRLNARYFGSPADRAAVIRELVGRQEKLINHVLLRQSAQTLRDHAQRVRSAPRQSALPRVTPAQLTATDPQARRREGIAAASRQLGEIYDHFA